MKPPPLPPRELPPERQDKCWRGKKTSQLHIHHAPEEDKPEISQHLISSHLQSVAARLEVRQGAAITQRHWASLKLFSPGKCVVLGK